MKKHVGYRNIYTYEQRKQESSDIMGKYPDRIPIIAEVVRGCGLNQINKNKYLVPRDLTVGQFSHVIRKRLALESYKALFLMVNGKIPNTSILMSSLYDMNKDDDGFLYVSITSENAFGDNF